MLMAIIQAIPTILTALTSALPQIISAITDILISNAPEILMATLELLGGILEAIPQIVASLASAVPSIVTAITQPLTAGLSNLGSLALKWGGDLVNGFISGITGKLAPLRDKVKGLADTIKSYLHFSEPDVGPLSDFTPMRQI
jgi:phage-related protein